MPSVVLAASAQRLPKGLRGIDRSIVSLIESFIRPKCVPSAVMRAAAVFTLACVVSSALAKPGILSGPLITTLTSAAPIGLDGRVLDTPEVAVAKAEHAAAQLNERLTLADEAVRSSGVVGQRIVAQQPILLAGQRLLVPGAPIGPDGRVVDTAEVAVAKAAHAAAQVNERIGLANEAARSVGADLNR